MKKILIKSGHHNSPLIAALYRAGIGEVDKVLEQGGRHPDYPVVPQIRGGSIWYDWADGYHGYIPYHSRGLWVDPISDRAKFVEYIANATERKDYPDGRWVFGTNIHNTASIADFDQAVEERR